VIDDGITMEDTTATVAMTDAGVSSSHVHLYERRAVGIGPMMSREKMICVCGRERPRQGDTER